MKPKYYLGLFFLLILFLSLIRPVNYDEAYYIASSQQILEGKSLYSDFPFHQMPLSLYLYIPISELGFLSLIFGRLISVSLFFISYLILLKVLSKYSNLNTRLLFTVLFFLNLFLVDWIATIRIYALSVFLLSIGIYYFDLFKEKKDKGIFLVISAASFTLLVFTKIVFIANLLLFLIYAVSFLYRNKKTELGKYLPLIFASVLIPFILFFVLFGARLGYFYFNTFEINIVTRKFIDEPFLQGLIKFIGFFFIPQNFLLLIIIIISGYKYNVIERFLLLNIVIFVLVHILSRMHAEYLTSVSGLFILLAALSYENFYLNLKIKFKNISFHRITGIVLALYLLACPFSVAHFKYLVQNRPVASNPVQFYSYNAKMSTLKGRTLLTSWEGYGVFSTKITLLKENYGSSFFNEIDVFDESTKTKYHLILKDEYKKLIINKTPDIIVYDTVNPAHLEGMKEIIEKNYSKSFIFNSAIIYERL